MCACLCIYVLDVGVSKREKQENFVKLQNAQGTHI